ncbi:MAG: shikimate dehydrogenase [Deltaproteobacteria bacterium]|nr:shikimate dehydrogenase [Deltaproteobacteria bacterium]MBW1817903.1 shikimate dehydrogenase [Deltaproteobacteria bacterium]
MVIDHQTRLFGVMGNPIGHTLSPVMHNAAFAETGVNAVYLAFETTDAEGCLQGIRSFGMKGMSVTIPHKSSVIPHLDAVDETAKRIGAVNTIVNREGRLYGFNTDAIGALKALEDRMDLPGKTGLIIGAGGAARAIGFALKQKGVHVTIANRSTERGAHLARFLGCAFSPLDGIGGIHPDLLVQTTPVGMHPHIDACIVAPEFLEKGMIVMDIVYNPMETKLLALARSRGCLTISGLDMFINQGAEQFRLWTGLEPPVAVMSRAVEAALGINP